MSHGIYNILNVTNLDKSRAFYKSLGLKTVEEKMPMSPEFTMQWVTVSGGKDHAMMIMRREFPAPDQADVK